MSKQSAPRQRVVVIAGEDAAPEAMAPSVELIDAMGLGIEWSVPEVGEASMASQGKWFPREARRAIDDADATFFGATSGATAAALFYLRWGKRTYANVRPARFMPGCRSPLREPEGIDFVIVRENLEDLYVGMEGEIETLTGVLPEVVRARRPLADYAPARYALKVISEAGSRRVLRFAFELARKRRAAGHPGRVTCTAKFNMLAGTDGYFGEIATDVARDHPDVELEHYIIDDFSQRMITHPQSFDVVVMPNLYGDIMSDAAAGLIGGLGLAPSGCYGDDYAYFESAHGTAPDIAGRHVINPTATLLSGAMMLEYLGHADAARRLEQAIRNVYAEGKHLTPDQGGRAGTREFCDAVASSLGV